METRSAEDADNTSRLNEFLNFTMNDTINRLWNTVSETIGLRMAEDPVFLTAGTLRTAVDGALMAVPPSEPAHLVVAFWDSPLSHGINVFVGLVLCFTMLGLGCTVEISQIEEHIRRPIGVLLALVCQFVIMPMVAFLLALAVSLDDVAAMAVLLCGCCPGGTLSNIMSLLVNGEMNLR